MTPWFAAGTGFVIAAGLWIYSPHTSLRFPSSGTYSVPCQPLGCNPARSGQGGGRPAASGPGVQLKRPQHHRPGIGPDTSGQQAAISGLTFAFTILWQHDGKFGAYLAISGDHLPDSWRLAFAMPGTHIEDVLGAAWQPSASGDGGTASSDSGWHSDNGQSSHDISVLVSGTGSANTPASCVFNGAGCSFVSTGPGNGAQADVSNGGPGNGG